MKEYLKMQSAPKAAKESIVLGKNYRITVLTERLLRLEYSEGGTFEDRATQAVVNRSFPVPDFEVNKTDDGVEVTTKYLHLIYDGGPFTSSGLSIHMKRNPYMTRAWHYGDRDGNLKGTARTLDGADGQIPMEDGLLSTDGYSVYDDSRSLVINEEGWVESALEGHSDLYFWGYGRDYRACLHDFYRLCGSTPLLPRYAMGNWWSRYHAYTQEEYLALMDRFMREKLPFSVSVIDMDWHYVKLEERFGNGWTGYTWNEELFPDHVAMLGKLHEQGRRVTLNLHPADGVRAHEKAYPAMAKAMGMDPQKEEAIPFDIASQEFLDAYFDCLHHPLEEEGVDFWWIDWQQGSSSKIPGLDPLWMLNHYHYYDNGRNKKRPLIFSRYAGVGSHRYPVGFSGDTVITWKSLQFQPYFTACASNVGYSWWSHDIGGHMGGTRDDELTVRWVQYGAFSPIMRLHSSCNTFSGKEPWNYGMEERTVMADFLRLRHMLIPYLYTMNYRTYGEGEPLVQPLYYQYPDRGEAYERKNEYFFGTSLLVNPATEPMDPALRMAEVVTWLPGGVWYDFFTGLRYAGGRTMKLYRAIDSIPVLARAGAVIPMAPEEEVSEQTDNPSTLLVRVFAGADGEFTLYEDDGVSEDYREGHYASTRFCLDWEKEGSFVIESPQGDVNLLPQKRTYRIAFTGVTAQAVKKVLLGTKEIGFTESYDAERKTLTVSTGEVCTGEEVKVVLDKDSLAQNNVAEEIYKRLNRAQISYDVKERIYYLVQQKKEPAMLIGDLQVLDAPQAVKDMVMEPLLADCGH